VEAADDEAVPACVEEREREALVTARLLERVEPDEPDPLQRAARAALEDGRPGGQLVELTGDVVDLLEVGVEDRLDAPTG
jgi:hypothetical protein